MRRLLALFALALPAQAQTLRVLESTAGFEATARVFGIKDIGFEGTGGKVTGTLILSDATVAGILEVKLADLKTGLSGRDEHMQDSLGVATFPTAKLELEPVTLQAGTLPIKGKLTIKGQTKPAVGACQVSVKDTVYQADCTLDVKLSDYPAIDNLKRPGAVVKDDVKVKVSFKAAP